MKPRAAALLLLLGEQVGFVMDLPGMHWLYPLYNTLMLKSFVLNPGLWELVPPEDDPE